MNKSPELLAPAGDLSIAIKAFLAGADAVYVGLKDFSARKNAINFDWDDLRKLRTFAIDHNKKIYIAINTIIKNSEIPQLIETLSYLEFMGINGIIIQDLGILYLIKKYFPSLTVHASTQMAVNSVEGVLMAQEMGISRVILPRETSLSTMKLLRERCPNVELETFIHGALCYSYSGLCLISGLLMERSGNRGECAQLCRKYYRTEQGMLYPFACNDLFLSGKVKELQKIGIHSLKIEGRLKKAEYVESVVKLYRYILDNQIHDKKHIEELEQNISQIFSRHKTEAYLHDSHGQNLINPYFPKNVGKHLGKIRNISGKKIEIDSSHTPLKKGDELLVLHPGFNQNAIKLVVTRVQKEIIEVYSIEQIEKNDEIYLFNRQNHEKAQVLNRLLPWKKPLSVDVDYSNQQLSLKCKISDTPIEQTIELQLIEQQGSRSIVDAFKAAFLKTDKSWFVGNLNIETPQWENKFLPPSKIKELKKSFWEEVDKIFKDKIKNKATSANLFSKSTLSTPTDSFFSQRSNLSVQRNAKLPFAHIDDLSDIKNFASYNDEVYIPLHPLLSTTSYLESLSKLIKSNQSTTFVIGLNNLSHLHWSIENKFENVSFWIDFNIYIANSATLNLICSYLTANRIRFAYSWIEDIQWNSNLVQINDKEKMPLMISRGCINKNVIDRQNQCQNCNGSFSYSLSGGHHDFIVQGKDCINYIFLKPQPPSRL